MNIREAAAVGNINRVRQLLNKKNEKDRHTGVTPLMIAAFHGRGPIARLLINAGANVNARTPLGTTALKHAMNYGHHSVVRNLIMAGATIGNHNTRGYSAALRNTIAQAQAARKAEIQKILLQKVFTKELTPNQLRTIVAAYAK